MITYEYPVLSLMYLFPVAEMTASSGNAYATRSIAMT